MKKKFIGVFILLLSVFIIPNNVFAQELEAALDKVAPNGNLSVKTVVPTTEDEAIYVLTSYVSQYDDDVYSYNVWGCSQGYTTCDLKVSNSTDSRMRTVTVTYETLDADVKAKVDSMFAQIDSVSSFEVSDLDLINYVLTGSINKFADPVHTALSFADEYRNFVSGSNLNSIFYNGMGSMDPFKYVSRGGIVFWYDDAIYRIITNRGLTANLVMYVPDDTADSTEAYVAAVQKRIDEYTGIEDKLKVTYGGKLVDLGYDESVYNQIVDVTKIRDEYYYLEYNNEKHMILIEKNSAKMMTMPTVQTKDISTNIAVSTTSPSVPLDTRVLVNQILGTTQEFKDIIGKLNVKEAVIYDLKLFSTTANQYITKISDGKFKVTIPIPDSFVGKKLVAYYINDDGKIDEHPVTTDENNNASFETNHFSTYTIAVKEEFPSPPTLDNITIYFVLGMISIIGLAGASLYLRKSN